MKVLVCGGHLTPALGLIESLPKNFQVLYAGRKYAMEGEKTLSLEYQTIVSQHIPFREIQTGRIQRTWTKYTILSLLKLPIGFLHALKIIKEFKPDIIIGFGGYVSVPLCICGYFLNIPIVIHEQTLQAGLANKFLAPFASKICISWQESGMFFPHEKTILTGNPAVNRLVSTDYNIPISNMGGGVPKIVIVGGSQGSHFINQLVEKCLSELSEKYEVFHQTGDAKEFGDFDKMNEIRKILDEKKQKMYTIVKFIQPKEVISLLRKADLVISRSGMNTITELLLLNKPALFIPLPITQYSEQIKNALFFQKHGLGEILYQESATPEKFLSTIHAMIQKRKEYTVDTNSAELMIHKDAGKKIIEILDYVHKTSSQKKS